MQFPRATSIFTIPSFFNSEKLYRFLPRNLKTGLHAHVTSYASCTINKTSMFTLQKIFARFTNPTELREHISQTVRSFKSQCSISTFSARSIDHPRNWMSAASVNPIATKLSIYLDIRHSKGTFYAESTTKRWCWSIQGYETVTMTLRRTRLDTEEIRTTPCTGLGGALNVAIGRTPFVWTRRRGRGRTLSLDDRLEPAAAGLRSPGGTLDHEFLPKEQLV